MRSANWKDYELIDTSQGERLERWGDIILIRPDPQIIFCGEMPMHVIIVLLQAAENGSNTEKYLMYGR